jgi:alpha-N-arabinofuranosidase
MNGKQPMVSTLLAITLGLAANVSAQGKNTQQAAKSEEIMKPIHISVESRELHRVDARLFGQFLERPSWGETGPEIATDDKGKLSAEVVDMLRAMRIPIVRFPGGTDIDYIDWTDMISNAPGRAPERPATTGHKGQQVSNRFGYDEYLRLAADLDWESILVVNFLDGLAKRKPLAEAARHAAGLVAYANAPLGAKLPEGMPDWPAIRARNGHPEPYGVKTVQIGNEWKVGGFWRKAGKRLGSDEPEVLIPWFQACIIAYADAMRAVDPEIELIVDGEMGRIERPGGEILELAAAVLADPEIRKRVKYATFHCYASGQVDNVKRDGADVDPATMRPEQYWLAITAMPGAYDDTGVSRAMAKPWYGAAHLQSVRQLGYEVINTEWNWNCWGKAPVNFGEGIDWRHGAAIGAAGFLNGLLRQADDVSLATQSMLLGHRWGIAAIRVDQQGKNARFNAQGAVTAFYSRHHGDRMLEIRTDGVPRTPQPFSVVNTPPVARLALLDTVATRSDDKVYLHVINRAYDQDLEAEIDLSALGLPDGEAVLHLLEGTPPDQVAARKAWMTERSLPVAFAGGKARVLFPKRSVAVLEAGIKQGKQQRIKP